MDTPERNQIAAPISKFEVVFPLLGCSPFSTSRPLFHKFRISGFWFQNSIFWEGFVSFFLFLFVLLLLLLVCSGEFWFWLCNLMWVLASLCCGGLKFVSFFKSSNSVSLGWFAELASFVLNQTWFCNLTLLSSCDFGNFKLTHYEDEDFDCSPRGSFNLFVFDLYSGFSSSVGGFSFGSGENTEN